MLVFGPKDSMYSSLSEEDDLHGMNKSFLLEQGGSFGS